MDNIQDRIKGHITNILKKLNCELPDDDDKYLKVMEEKIQLMKIMRKFKDFDIFLN